MSHYSTLSSPYDIRPDNTVYASGIYGVVPCPEEDGGIYRVVISYDPYHEPDYGLDTEEETQAAIQHELRMLEFGEWTAYSVHTESFCPHCGNWTLEDSVYGCVFDTGTSAEKIVDDMIGL